MDVPYNEILRINGSRGGPRLPKRHAACTTTSQRPLNIYGDEEDDFHPYGCRGNNVYPPYPKQEVEDEIEDFRFWVQMNIKPSFGSVLGKCRLCYGTERDNEKRKEHKNGDCREKIKRIHAKLKEMQLCTICGKANTTTCKWHFPLCSSLCKLRFKHLMGGVGFNLALRLLEVE